MAPLGVAARSAAFSPDGELIAVGLKNGAFVVLKTADLKIVAQKRDRHQAIQDVRLIQMQIWRLGKKRWKDNTPRFSGNGNRENDRTWMIFPHYFVLADSAQTVGIWLWDLMTVVLISMSSEMVDL